MLPNVLTLDIVKTMEKDVTKKKKKKKKKKLNKMASIFDPAGFHSFIFLFRKIFLKEL